MANQPEAVLVVERGIDDFSIVPLNQPAYELGKSASSNIVLDNPYVSRRHARIVVRRGHFEIEDLGSKNGTSVNGTLLGNRRVRLRYGDRIELGQGQVILKFQHLDSTLTLPAGSRNAAEALVVDAKSRDVWIRGNRVDPPLSRKEFDILTLLYDRRGEACSKDEIADRGWPERLDGDVGDQDIEQYIRRLRRRVEPDPSHPQYIINVRGFGYKLAGI